MCSRVSKISFTKIHEDAKENLKSFYREYSKS